MIPTVDDFNDAMSLSFNYAMNPARGVGNKRTRSQYLGKFEPRAWTVGGYKMITLAGYTDKTNILIKYDRPTLDITTPVL